MQMHKLNYFKYNNFKARNSTNKPCQKKVMDSAGSLFSVFSNDILKDMYILTEGKIALVGCGGVSSGEDAY
ncbi:hypothetical protein L1987_77355 [Smallanthus sonchifolius]|uniref:Uncharacterized protein n=1 Tax=Smallanthus sonchifolius TaxID=185202 RepID=A0ACB8ZE53_9ASTR|nr:hypothetical protein L1987_77355 [Smallanthus sonchifolius]